MTNELSQAETLEPWLSLSNWEQQCVDEVEKTPDIEIGFQTEKDRAAQKLWSLFQNAATGIAQLYKDRQHGISLWVPFQNAASNVTALYRESADSQKKFYDMGFQSGLHRRNKDLLSWAKKRKRHIQREELIAYLTGRNPPPQRHWAGPRPRLSLDGMRSLSHLAHAHRFSAVDSNELRTAGNEEPNFDMFREAIGFSPNLKHHSTGSPTNSYNRMSRIRHCSPVSANHSELSAFISEEFTRHYDSRKRSPSTDVIMDSPTHKRSRLSHIL